MIALITHYRKPIRHTLIMPINCRAAWQRKVDGLIRQEEGRDRLREVSRLQLAFPLPDKQVANAL